MDSSTSSCANTTVGPVLSPRCSMNMNIPGWMLHGSALLHRDLCVQSLGTCFEVLFQPSAISDIRKILHANVVKKGCLQSQIARRPLKAGFHRDCL